MTVVGIDLGTTNTVVAAVRDDRATALKDKLGRALLPSIVSFTPKGAAKVGVEAKARRTLDPENTIFSTKRLIGRSFDSEQVQRARARLPFELKEGPGHSILVSSYGEEHTLPEISALVLKRAQEIAEARLGSTTTDAIITVPANFNDLQRAATKVAGRAAGLEVLRIINEPTAAALAYGYGKSGHERIAIYDFGGGTFDVTILDQNDNVFEVLATAGDTFLGGDDIDQAIMDRMGEQLLKEHKVDAEKDNLVREQLRAAAERLKIDLSTRSLAKTRIEELEFDFTMRRSEFEKLAEPLLGRTLDVCKEAMEIAGLDKSSLDQVLLVGGSTRIPIVRRRTSAFFGKMPQSRINPDEVVAIGAAIQAASLEAKQGAASIPAAPGRETANLPRKISARPVPLDSKTRSGLAGLSKTLSGAAATEQTTVSRSGLKSLQSIAPSVSLSPSAKRRLGPAQTLSGVGGSLSPAPLTTKDDKSERDSQSSPSELKSKTGSTNLGLGIQPGGPSLSFDDITAVIPGSDDKAAVFNQDADEYEDFEDEVTDGSVTFDLASLGLDDEPASDFSDLDDEPTHVYDSKSGKSLSAPPAENAELPTVASGNLEEIGYSALFSLDVADDDEAELPTPSRKGGASGDLEVELPSPLSRPDDSQGSALAATAIGHPSPRSDLPTRAHDGSNLPLRSGKSNLPEKKSSEDSLQPSQGLDFETAIQNSAPISPDISDLDELSVAALLPGDDGGNVPPVELEASEFGLDTAPPEASVPPSGPSFAPGRFLSQAASAPQTADSIQPRPSTDSPPASFSSASPSAFQPTTGAPLLLDVTPLSLGVEVSGGYVDALIARNSPIPCESTRTFATTRDNQPLVRVKVSQGEESRFNRNTLLGELELTGISQGPRGTVKIDVCFSLDESGLLQVTARDVATGNAADARLKLVGVAES